MMKLKYILIFILFMILISCSDKPKQIVIGRDNCDYCKMMITDTKYASQLITPNGKIYLFDSIECLAAYYNLAPNKQGSSLWVPDFSNSKTYIEVSKALFLKSSKMKSPMSLNLSAYSKLKDLEKVKNNYGGKKLTWKEVMNYVQREWNL